MPVLEVRAAHAHPARGHHPRRAARPSCSRRAWWRTSTRITPRLGRMVRDAARLARYGGVKELRHCRPTPIGTAAFLRRDPGGGARRSRPVLIDVSAPASHAAWTAAMGAHASQTSAPAITSNCSCPRARCMGLRGRRGPRHRRCSRTIRWSFDSLAPARPRGAAILTCRLTPLRIGITCYPSVGGSGMLASALGEELAAARPRGPFHQLRAPVPHAGRRPAPLFPSGGDQRLRTVQIPRLHAAPVRQDGGGEPRPPSRRAPCALRRAARHRRDSCAIDAAAGATARGS